MTFPHQLPLFTRDQECRGYLDPDRRGMFAVLVDINGRKRQSMHWLSRLVEVLEGLNPAYDTWCTQAEFMGPQRCMNNLARLDLLFADLDTYRVPHLQNRSPEALVSALHRFCSDEGIVPPSLVVFSGRGLQPKWLLERPIPHQALPRWNAVQKALVDKLMPMGADAAVRDASRVLRVVQTTNTKSNEQCRVVDVVTGPDGLPRRYNFELLHDEFLPVGRQALEARRQELAEHRQLRLIQGGHRSGLRRFSGRQLAWDRVQDLRRLLELRGGAHEGERMRHLFWQLNFLLLSDITNLAPVMFREAAFLAKQLDPRWNYRSQELSTLYRKAKAHGAGQRVDFEGKSYPSLYTPKNDTLINIFNITDNEQRTLQTIISQSVAAERHRARDEARRRAEGEKERQSYLESVRVDEKERLKSERERSERRRREQGSQANCDIVSASTRRMVDAHRLRSEGLSIRQIASKIGISKSMVAKYLRCPLGDQGVPAYY